MNFNKLALNIAHFLPPEISNKISLESLKLLYKLNILEKAFSIQNLKVKPTELMGLSFPNKIGVAGGLDKNANYFHILGKLGFGFVEVGTITLKPQKGNPKPRIHRFAKDKSIVNSLGFNNVGVFQALKNIEKNKTNFNGILGVSLGKGKEILNERAHEDYLHLMDYLYDVSDYLAINISSPNTADLRDLTLDNFFNKLIDKIMNKSEQLSGGSKQKKPIIIKISPNESKENLEKIINYSLESNVNGFIVTNTSVDHKYNIPGGVSGLPLKIRAGECLKFVRSITGPTVTLIGSGGLMSEEDVKERFIMSADLVQLYSGFIFKGNDLLQDCLKIQ